MLSNELKISSSSADITHKFVFLCVFMKSLLEGKLCSSEGPADLQSSATKAFSELFRCHVQCCVQKQLVSAELQSLARSWSPIFPQRARFAFP